MNFVASHIAADPKAARKTVRDAIAQLEKRIADEFGFKVNMGAELEYTVEYKRGKTPGFIDAHNCTLGFPRNTSSSLPLSRLECYSYREAGWRGRSDSHGTRIQLETVLTHKHPLSMTGFADAIEGLQKETLRSGGTEFVKQPETRTTHPLSKIIESRIEAQKLHTDRVAHVSLDSALFNNGLHLNVSLEPILSSTCAPYLTVLSSTVARLFRHDMSLIIVTDEEKKREKEELHSDKCYAKGTYLENKFPAATNNAHVVVLMQLAGLYLALKKNHNVDYHQEISLASCLQQTIPEATDVYNACVTLTHAPRETTLQHQR